MMHRGRERRRKGVVNRTRRLLYAVLLWLSPQASGASTLADPAAPAEASGFLPATLIIESFPAAVGSSLSAYRVVFVAPDSRIAAPFQKAAELLRKRSWKFNDSSLSLRGGVGLDVGLPDDGNLHLSLFPDEDDPQRGRRWQLSTTPNNARGRLWSVGGCVDVVRTQQERSRYEGYTDREIAVSPQLILDMDRLAGIPGTAQLVLQNANWRDGVTERYTDERVWQINVLWRF